MTIIVKCRTNLDRYKREEWPERMHGIPHVGDHVESASGARLTVIKVRHPCGKWDHGHESYYELPALDVELHYDDNQLKLDELRGYWP